MASSPKEVFVTYSYDSTEHRELIIGFTNMLRTSGFHADMDQSLMQQQTSIDLRQMMHRAMTDYEKVIVVLSSGYKAKAQAFQGGAGSEYSLIIRDIEYHPNKYILVSFEGIHDRVTPLFFKRA